MHDLKTDNRDITYLTLLLKSHCPAIGAIILVSASGHKHVPISFAAA